MDFLKDVGQRAGDGCSVRDGETDAIILPGSGVRVLPEYDNLHLVKRTDIKNVKDTGARRQHMGMGIFVPHESGEPFEIRLVKLFLQAQPPAFFNFHFHGMM